MKQIVLLEDNLYQAEDLEFRIKFALRNTKTEYKISVLHSIYEINEFLFKDDGVGPLKDEMSNLFLIVDLNMDPDGLDTEMTPNTVKFTGWYWLKEKIDKNQINPGSIRIIVFSAFIESFIDYFNADELVSGYIINKTIQLLDRADNSAELINKIVHYLN